MKCNEIVASMELAQCECNKAYKCNTQETRLASILVTCITMPSSISNLQAKWKIVFIIKHFITRNAIVCRSPSYWNMLHSLQLKQVSGSKWHLMSWCLYFAFMTIVLFGVFLLEKTYFCKEEFSNEIFWDFLFILFIVAPICHMFFYNLFWINTNFWKCTNFVRLCFVLKNC